MLPLKASISRYIKQTNKKERLVDNTGLEIIYHDKWEKL